MNRKQLRRHDLHYLMSFIDFAFMVIIIFISLLSVAYFDPPGSAGVKRQKALYTVKDAQELQKLGLTPAQVKELLVVRRRRILQERKLQDLATKKAAVPAAEFHSDPKNIQRESLRLKENTHLKKKMTLLERQIAQMKKQVAILEAQKKQITTSPAQKKITDKTGVPSDSAKEKEPFGGHEFLDLRK